ncbi:hypothetical protein [Ammonifex thiophilus]|uniref:Cytochrome C n=1 Tax=Ammonifex thiophilus TaxID=444093 RepID=A0A3D8P0U5_9THEO|nr:hypothetical protein [Ammonifex thiophilus]RDV80516.1 hypothetical protein DXX99_10695 [Ammonifex thiophilus]
MRQQKGVSLLVALLFLGLVAFPAAVRGAGKAPPFYLRTETGAIINPVTGENADQPYSPRQTCGACHDYEAITKGYHFQQGWDVIKDGYSKEKPWVLSNGMMGKW